MVNLHMRAAQDLPVGVASMPGVASSFTATATQAAWRFLNNDRAALPDVVEPLRELGRLRTESLKSTFVMLVHDW